MKVSKKYTMTLIVEILLTAIMYWAFTNTEMGFSLVAMSVAVIITMGFVAIVYTGKQSHLDIYKEAMKVPGKLMMHKLGIEKHIEHSPVDDA